jgi:hypothetical protein
MVEVVDAIGKSLHGGAEGAVCVQWDVWCSQVGSFSGCQDREVDHIRSAKLRQGRALWGRMLPCLKK